MELAGRNDIVPQENVQGAMSCDLHGGGHIHAGVDEIADGRATEIVGDKPSVLKPSFTCLFSKSALNTRLVPLPTEIPGFKYRAFALEFLGRVAAVSVGPEQSRFLPVPERSPYQER